MPRLEPVFQCAEKARYNRAERLANKFSDEGVIVSLDTYGKKLSGSATCAASV